MKKMLRHIVEVFSPRKQLKVGWLLLGDRNTGSSRIHGLNIHDYFLQVGIKSEILQTNEVWTRTLTLSKTEQEAVLASDINVLIFQKVFDDGAIRFAENARKKGIKTIFLLSDKHDTPMAGSVDQLVVTSTYLKEYFKDKVQHEPVVIEDAVEWPEKLFKRHCDKKTLELIWVGHRDNWESLDIVHNVLKTLPSGEYSLKTISNHPSADIPWELTTVFKEILTGDIAVIPTLRNEWSMSKSNNRLTMFMALGMPVIASEIPAYSNIVFNGENGFLAEKETDWAYYLQALKDKNLRLTIGKKARQDASAYKMSKIGKQWATLLEKLVSDVT